MAGARPAASSNTTARSCPGSSPPARIRDEGVWSDGRGSGSGRETEEDSLFPDQLRGPVRRAPGQACAGASDRGHAGGRRRLRRLRRLARQQSRRARHAGQAGPRDPDPAAVEAGGRLARRRLLDERRAHAGHAPPQAQEQARRGEEEGLPGQDRRRGGVFHRERGRHRDLRPARYPGQALLRPGGPDAPLRRRLGDLRRHAEPRLGPLSERPRRRQRPVRDELGL